VQFTPSIRRRQPFLSLSLTLTLTLIGGGASPFYAGFGNRDTDVISYSSVGVPEGKIFVINPSGEIQVQNVGGKKSYGSLVEVKGRKRR